MSHCNPIDTKTNNSFSKLGKSLEDALNKHKISSNRNSEIVSKINKLLDELNYEVIINLDNAKSLQVLAVVISKLSNLGEVSVLISIIVHYYMLYIMYYAI